MPGDDDCHMSETLTDPYFVPGVLFGKEGTCGAKLDVDTLLQGAAGTCDTGGEAAPMGKDRILVVASMIHMQPCL